MERKPIKRNEHIVKLSQDHHASLLFCFKIRQGLKRNIDPQRIRPYIEYFSQHHFREHFAEEEEILFRPLQDKKVKQAMNEHVVILNLVDRILASDGGTQEQLLELASLVDNHVRYEERVLFPHLEKVLTEEQLEDIGNRLPDDALCDNYPDHFWKK